MTANKALDKIAEMSTDGFGAFDKLRTIHSIAKNADRDAFLPRRLVCLTWIFCILYGYLLGRIL